MSRRNRAKSSRRGRQPEPSSPPERAESESIRRPWVWVVRAAVSIYVVWLIVRPPELPPELRAAWRRPQFWIHDILEHALDAIGYTEPSRFLQSGAFYVLTCLLVPLAVCVMLGRHRPGDTGWRKPNRLLVKIVGCSFLVSAPFLFWMVRSADFLPYYTPYLEAGPAIVLTYYVVVLFAEHFFFEGVMLAAFRADGRWPEPPTLVQDARSGWRRVAQWFGVAQPVGGVGGSRRLTRWLGLPDGCLTAILLSGVLFGLVHWGKAGREFVLAFPGGVFLAALAYRCNSWHAPYLLHAGTVTMAGAMFYLLHG